jgi:hypothetical protein
MKPSTKYFLIACALWTLALSSTGNTGRSPPPLLGVFGVYGG